MRPFKFKDRLVAEKEKKKKYRENIFTAIKYSGLKDSNKFFLSHVYSFFGIFMDQ